MGGFKNREFQERERQIKFWRQVMIPNACWFWIGRRGSNGYGEADCAGERSAHRAIYRMCRGPIPLGMELDHLCGVRTCVNPLHLEAVSHVENTHRRAIRNLYRREIA